MKKSSFTKPATTIDEQFMILRARGMSFDDGLDKSCIKTILRNNNYFRLEGCWFEYYESRLYPEHRFRCQTSFRSIWNDYRGDSLIRHAIFELIEIFELSFRSVMANVLARNHGPFPYGIDDFDCSRDTHAEVLGRIHGAVHHSKDIFIKKFYEHYSNPLPPIWMIVEIMSLGELSRIYGICLKAFDKRRLRHITASQRRFSSPGYAPLCLSETGVLITTGFLECIFQVDSGFHTGLMAASMAVFSPQARGMACTISWSRCAICATELVKATGKDVSSHNLY